MTETSNEKPVIEVGMEQMMDVDQFVRPIELANRAFSPSSPITEKELFAGRQEQLDRLSDVLSSRGQHALVYGDRGVGKTSLAKVGRGQAIIATVSA